LQYVPVLGNCERAEGQAHWRILWHPFGRSGFQDLFLAKSIKASLQSDGGRFDRGHPRRTGLWNKDVPPTRQ
jgi:hypothetical protein